MKKNINNSCKKMQKGGENKRKNLSNRKRKN